MKFLAPIALVLLLLGLGSPPVPLTAQSAPGVGVLPFNNGGSFGQDAKDYEALTVGLQQILITELARHSGLRLVERGRLDDLMAEQNIPANRVDPETAVRIGRLVGARYMIIGGFVEIYGTLRLDARIVDTETSEVLDADRVEGERSEMLSLTVELADRIANKADLPSRPEGR